MCTRTHDLLILHAAGRGTILTLDSPDEWPAVQVERAVRVVEPPPPEVYERRAARARRLQCARARECDEDHYEELPCT